MLRREEALSRRENPEAEASCRIGLPRISPIVPAFIRHLRSPHVLIDYALLTARGYRAAQTKPANSRATATTAFVEALPRAWNF